MSDIEGFKALVTAAVQSNGINRIEFEEIVQKAMAYTAQADRLEIESWLKEKKLDALVRALFTGPADYDSFDGPRPVYSIDPKGMTSVARKYLPKLEQIGYPLDLRQHGRVDAGAMRNVAYVLADDFFPFIREVVIPPGEDTGMWTNLTIDAVNELGRQMAARNAPPALVDKVRTELSAGNRTDHAARAFESGLRNPPSPSGGEQSKPIKDALSQDVAPRAVTKLYVFTLSADGKQLTIDPNRPKNVLRGGEPERDYVAIDSAANGKTITLAGGAFKSATWVQRSLKELVPDPQQQKELVAARYRLDALRDLLIVTGENSAAPTIFAFSESGRLPGLVGVGTKVTPLDMLQPDQRAVIE